MRTEQLLVQEKAAFPRVEPPCPYFGACGGCALQDVAYPDQLVLKRERLGRALAALGDVPSVELIGLEDPWRYRNKAEFTFGEQDGRLALGYHAARSFWRVVDLDDCLLVPEPAARVLRDVRDAAARTGLPPYHPRTHQGFFRHLLVRISRATGRLLVCLMTSPACAARSPEGGAAGRPASAHGATGNGADVRAVVEGLAHDVAARHPAIGSFYWGLTGRVADIAVPEELILLEGTPHLEERMGPFRIKLHPLSFLQPNTAQADRMYATVCERLRPGAGGVAWDLYCGLGLIAFYLASRMRKVYGIDGEPHHLELAALNASLNGMRNVEFRAGKVEALLLDRRFWLQEARPDVIVADPPRAGLHPQAIASILAARPLQIAYLSCNVQSLVRDLGMLCTGFPRYRLAALQAFDMFPQTNHLETFALLER
ncbi:MAG: class I SAM-dependent RNA methyltransferase [Candidatus Omnitrophica bacterium]|nr:class I SAM-dependent RNA methyltransferase [Candidatus Omnitrophota bacterium]